MTDRPTPAVEAAMRAIHADLAARFPGATLDLHPIYQHWEDEELGYPPLYEQLTLHLRPVGVPVWCTSNREGSALAGMFSACHDARHPAGAHALVFDPAERALLRAHGWRGSGTWQAKWSADAPAKVVAAVAALATTAPRVLLPEDLRGAPWPWTDLLFYGLLADHEGTEGAGERRIVRTRVDGEPHRIRLAEGSPWDALWHEWRAHPPRLRPYAAWRRP